MSDGGDKMPWSWLIVFFIILALAAEGSLS